VVRAFSLSPSGKELAMGPADLRMSTVTAYFEKVSLAGA
jgi:hypothetical protein